MREEKEELLVAVLLISFLWFWYLRFFRTRERTHTLGHSLARPQNCSRARHPIFFPSFLV
jgi:hypothetical protein